MLSDIPTGALVAALLFLVLLSALFSAAEASAFSLNRFRLRHLAKEARAVHDAFSACWNGLTG